MMMRTSQKLNELGKKARNMTVGGKKKKFCAYMPLLSNLSYNSAMKGLLAQCVLCASSFTVHTSHKRRNTD